jgi:ParB-like nuclease domain
MQKAIDDTNDCDTSSGLLRASDRKIELVAVARLKPYVANARTHSKKQIRQIADSIQRFGFTNPVLIDDEGMIVAGHGRVAAAKLLKLTAVPALRLSHLSDAEKSAYILADNRLAEKAGWDKELLAIELQGLIELDFDVEITGFEMPEIDLVLEDADEAKRESSGPEDKVPDPLPSFTVSALGDMWIMGSHRLFCGDARDNSAYQNLLGGDKAEFVFTDPPYNVAIDGHVCGKGAIRHRDFAMRAGR